MTLDNCLGACHHTLTYAFTHTHKLTFLEQERSARGREGKRNKKREREREIEREIEGERDGQRGNDLQWKIPFHLPG